jgi:phytoene dehydrogenase-like protein
MSDPPASRLSRSAVDINTATRAELPVVIVGAGMGGLACALTLIDAGRRVVVFEAGDGVGGRVRTDHHPDGYLLDRGFQVLLEAYPAVQRWLDLPALDLKSFDAGALVWTGRRLVPLADPLRHPQALLRDLTTSLFPVQDKLRLALLAARARVAGWSSAVAAASDPANDRSGAEELWAAGFSRPFVDRFARPFWGGILLDPTLAGSAGPLRFTLKMLLQGRAVLPAAGMRAMPDQLARRLPDDAIRLNQPVEALVIEDGRATGVRVGGATVAASSIVVATDPPSAKRLTGITSLPGPEDGLGCTTIYLTGRRDPGIGPRLILDGSRRLTVNHLAPLSQVAPSYATVGSHLLAAVVLGKAQVDDDDVLADRVRREAALLLGQAPSDWTVTAVARVPFSQFAQPPGVYGRLPGPVTRTRGLYLAGEAVSDSSYNGALLGGEAAAQAIMLNDEFATERPQRKEQSHDAR